MTDIARQTPRYSDTPEEREFELRAAVGSYWTGGRLFIGMFTFVLASEAFAYFYLRSSNNGQLWRPANITAPTSIGWAIYFMVLASAVLAIYGQWRMRNGLGDRLGGRRLDGGARWPGGDRAADLAADPAALLPRIEWVRLLFHRMGRRQHHDGAAARPTGSKPCWPAPSGCVGNRRRTVLPS